jgi:(5-formylfuran-3-yl)methyl phosphate synthase
VTGLLASVTSVEEAQIALAAGADIIDLKDPARGALGALTAERITTIVDALGGRCPVSATVGDLPPDPGVLSQRVQATAATGVDYVKVGLFGAAYFGRCVDALALQGAGVRLIAVLFADLKPELTALALLAQAGFTGVMLDTADKAAGGLRRHMSARQLARFVRSAKALGLMTGLAGSLKREDIPALLPVDPDYLGFRTALCYEQSRIAAVDPAAIAAVRAQLSRSAERFRFSAAGFARASSR